MSKVHQSGPRLPQTPADWGTEAERLAQQTSGKPLRADGSEREPHPEELPLESFLPPDGKKLSAADAERLVSQAGYERAYKKKNRKGFDVGDSSQAPIPLPSEDLEDAEWEQSALDQSQEDLTLEGAALESTAEEVGDGELSLEGIAKLLRHKFQPNEESVERLQTLADAPPQPALDMTAVQGHAQALFNKSLEGAPTGPQLLATSLLVAGAGEAVQAAGPGQSLEAEALLRGMQAVVDKGNQAVADARSMNEGISQKLAIQRTFVFKR